MKNSEIILTEKYSSFAKKVFYIKKTENPDVLGISKKDSLSTNVVHNFRKFFQEIFLPQGYPSSVSSDYTNYQIWDTTQAFCSTITGTLSTHAVMKGVGVGDIEATPLAATITWVLKDGTGNIGRILFAWWKGSSLDADSKKWRLFADILNDVAMCIEVALPLFYGYTTYMLCLSTALKAIVGVSGGATRAALTQHQALRGNLADVAAKDGSQETAVNLIASFVALFILSFIGDNIWPVFFLFTTLHLLANFYAVSSVCLDTFNSTRFLFCLSNYFKTNKVLSPDKTNKAESVIFCHNQLNDISLCGFQIKLGTSIHSLTKSKKLKAAHLKAAINASLKDKYLHVVDLNGKCIYIVLECSPTSQDILSSYHHALLLGIILSNAQHYKLVPSHNIVNDSIISECKQMATHYRADPQNEQGDLLSNEMYQRVREIANKSWHHFKHNAIKAGWNFEKNLLICGEWRANWKQKQE